MVTDDMFHFKQFLKKEKGVSHHSFVGPNSRMNVPAEITLSVFYSSQAVLRAHFRVQPPISSSKRDLTLWCLLQIPLTRFQQPLSLECSLDSKEKLNDYRLIFD